MLQLYIFFVLGIVFINHAPPNIWRFRVGSSSHNSGGDVYSVTRMAFSFFDKWAMTNDIAVIRTSTNIVFGTNVRAGLFSGPNYNLGNNQLVYAVGWGYNDMPLWQPANYLNLRRHQQSTIANNVCGPHYSFQGFSIREQSQICSGFSNPGAVISWDVPNKCLGEPGAPLVHGNTIVGVRSYALNCHIAAVPTISTRVGYYVSWISLQA